MKKEIEITKLMHAATGIDHSGKISITDNMSGLEEDPRDDWLYLGLKSFVELSRDQTFKPESVAIIGSGNGIDAIAILTLFPKIKKLYITDIIPEILPHITWNVESNRPYHDRQTDVEYLSGRDCQPIPEKVDFIYGNLPLVMVDANEISTERSTTTLTDASKYALLSNTRVDPLNSYSMLSQLGFILSAKEKLNNNGRLITLIGGRVPTSIIYDVFERAGMQSQRWFLSFMKQSDPEFLKQYAEIEEKNAIAFTFYDYDLSLKLIKNKWGIIIPDIIQKSEHEIRMLLMPAFVNAKQAFDLYKQNKNVGHLAYAFHATF